MKKYIFSLLTLMAMTFTAVTLTSCGDDDDSGNVASWMIGTWQECDSYGYLRNDATGYEVAHVTFNNNGTGRCWFVTRGTTTSWYEFKFSGSGNENSITGRTTITASSDPEEYPVGASESGTITISDSGIMYVELGGIYYKKVN